MPPTAPRGAAARLLALLTSTPGREFHTRDLVRRVGGSPRTVHVALEKLADQGLVDSRRLGPLRLWWMDPKHPLYRSLRELYARTVGVAARIRDVIARQEGVELAFIFGSYATGRDDARSDIDVFVLGDADWGPLEDESQRLMTELGREVSFVGWQTRDLARAVRTGSSFLETLRRSEKIWIVGGDHEFERSIQGVAVPTRRRRSGGAGVVRGDSAQARSRGAQPRPRTGGTRGRRP